MFSFYFYFGILFSITGFVAEGCDQRYFEENSFVCVCTESQCDSFPTILPPSDGTFGVIKSSKEEFRLDQDSGNLQLNNATYQAYAKIFINASDIRQTMFGFGGAFTDATGINVAKLSLTLQDTLMRQYFSPDGLEYTFGRIPIAGTDFSTYPYSYDDVEGDVELINFNLTSEDYLYKIPMIKRASELNEREMYLFSSPWSPPSWMKTNGMFNGSGGLIPEMQQPYANYIVKFLDAYAKEGINIWGLTVQNEPTSGTTDYPWNACHFTAEQERDFVRDYLGPTLNASGYDSLVLMIGDDQRIWYPDYVETILNDEKSAAFVDGIAVHWYADDVSSSDILTQVHDLFPDRFILYTESCNGEIGSPVALGSWERGERYAADIIDNVNHWSTGWVDWNLALDMSGGPNWANNNVDSPIIVNEESNEFYKQPMFYVLGHFSKLISFGSKYIGSTIEVFGLPAGDKGGLDVSSFRNIDGYLVSVVLNTDKEPHTIGIEDSSGNLIVYDLPAKSLQTFYYND